MEDAPAIAGTPLEPKVFRRPAALGIRGVAILAHRYVGLCLSVFLLLAGLTGSLLAFNEELDGALSPKLHRVALPAPGVTRLDPFEVDERVRQHLPADSNHHAVFFSHEPERALSIWIEETPGRWRQWFANPYTGEVLGSRSWGDLSEGLVNVMPFVYRLHYSLALGEVGSWLFGIVALLWTLDCFVGAYLTLPRAVTRERGSSRSWFARWLPAWLLNTSRLFSLIFSWHRASGLWVWAMLLVFAWSAVALNLQPVYAPVMSVLGYRPSVHDSLPELEPPHPAPGMDTRAAHAVGKRLMAEQAALRKFDIKRELWLHYAADHGAFVYGVESSLDITFKNPHTQVYFDAKDGHLIGFDAPTGMSAGNSVTNWLFGLHFAAVFGTWYRVFVLLMGLVVAALSASGVWIWWRKREKRATKQPDARQKVRVVEEPAVAA
ncbi:MAG: PepSY-associated TM helix domain-containing protein [Myxococcales bacterium]